MPSSPQSNGTMVQHVVRAATERVDETLVQDRDESSENPTERSKAFTGRAARPVRRQRCWSIGGDGVRQRR
jgi:hypothetical protein